MFVTFLQIALQNLKDEHFVIEAQHCVIARTQKIIQKTNNNFLISSCLWQRAVNQSKPRSKMKLIRFNEINARENLIEFSVCPEH